MWCVRLELYGSGPEREWLVVCQSRRVGLELYGSGPERVRLVVYQRWLRWIGSYTGVAQNEYGWWYINNGWHWTGSYTGVAQNEYGWWYINNGALDWNYTGLAQNENGWWYINQGALDWGYTGLAQKMSSGWWYVSITELWIGTIQAWRRKKMANGIFKTEGLTAVIPD